MFQYRLRHQKESYSMAVEWTSDIFHYNDFVSQHIPLVKFTHAYVTISLHQLQYNTLSVSQVCMDPEFVFCCLFYCFLPSNLVYLLRYAASFIKFPVTFLTIVSGVDTVSKLILKDMNKIDTEQSRKTPVKCNARNLADTFARSKILLAQN